MLMYTSLSLIISILLLLISFWISSMSPNLDKLSPYECGFDPLGSARLPYSMRFFLVAIMFLLFDLEIALLLPSPWAVQLHHPTLSISWAFIIIFLLTVGLLYEWSQGGLEWAE
uniref:NADH-ubiquinone oxidoreductase chain 3 n=1 Tax=Cornufer vitianus TaxID=1582976 RepID=A0A0K0LG18_CORVT|nr:NADH dehydrogenase subunit 3 [Cornufer vitianus]AIZ97082.1 NADH dehydrogenase subunit 3 [Cornufer vitianus]